MSLLDSVKVTKVVRRVLDFWLPMAIRDTQWFNRPLFHYWFRGENVREAMEFKDLAYRLSGPELLALLGKMHTRGDDRATDLGATTIDAILARLGHLPKGATVLDVGSGRGYLAKTLAEHASLPRVTGIDLRPPTRENARFEFVEGDIGGRLPFADESFDLVVSTHVLEHVKFPSRLAAELWRVAKREV